jgi:hypothetical protein
MALISLLSLLSLTTACSQAGAIAEVAQVKTPSSTQTSAGDYEALSNRVSELEKRVERLEQKSSQNNVDNIVITPSIPSPQDNFEKELHNIQTAVMAMMADSNDGMLDNSWTGISDLDLVTTNSGALILSNYMTGLNADGTVKSGCKYDVAKDGTVTQRTTIVTIPSPQDYEKELHNVQTAVMAMLADSATGRITVGTGIPQTNMHNVQTIGEKGMLYLSDYLTGLNGTSIQSGCTYTVAPDGTVTQTRP